MGDSTALMMIPMMGMSLSVVIAASVGAYYVYTQHKQDDDGSKTTEAPTPTATATPTTAAAVASMKSFTDGAKVYMSTSSGKYFTTKQHTNKSCDGILGATKTDGIKVQLTISGSTWQIKPDCDKDGNHTSYLTDEAGDLVQKKIKSGKNMSKQRWTVDCPAGVNGCTVRALDSKRYLGANADGTGLLLTAKSATGPSWIFETAV